MGDQAVQGVMDLAAMLVLKEAIVTGLETHDPYPRQPSHRLLAPIDEVRPHLSKICKDFLDGVSPAITATFLNGLNIRTSVTDLCKKV